MRICLLDLGRLANRHLLGLEEVSLLIGLLLLLGGSTGGISLRGVLLPVDAGGARRAVGVGRRVKPVLRVLQVDARRLRHYVRPLYLHDEFHVVGLEVIRLHQQRAFDMLPSIDSQWRLQEKSDLIPVCSRTPWCCRQVHSGVRSLEERIEPTSHAVDQARLMDLEVKRDLNPVQRLDRARGEIEPCAVALGDQALRVYVVDDGLAEVFLRAAWKSCGQVKTIERLVLPEAVLVLLLVVEHCVREGRDAEIPHVRKHLATRLEKAVARTQVGLDHPLVEEEGADWLGDEAIDLSCHLVVLDDL
mmetsp:Transcript_67038/g.143429  ORF Transcript_67038/g.143429 Transcript_67038/m.143429 type:complete len:303 (+) Transcript_67038:351-1259(+)